MKGILILDETRNEIGDESMESVSGADSVSLAVAFLQANKAIETDTPHFQSYVRYLRGKTSFEPYGFSYREKLQIFERVKRSR